MEYPSKRQKLSRIVTQFTQTFTGSNTNQEPNGTPISTTFPDGRDVRQTMVQASSEDLELRRRNGDSVVPRNAPARRSIPQRPRMHRRDSSDHGSERHKARSPQATVTKSVVDVIIDEGTSAVAALTITDPSKANTISISDIGVLTVPPITTLPTTITTSLASPTASDSSAISAAGSTTEQSVLSSPPVTPISSPTVSGSVSGLLPAVSALLSGKNITASVFTSTRSHTTITGTSIIDLSTLSRNNTTTRLVTSHTTLKTSIRTSHSGSSSSSIGTYSVVSGSGSPTGTASGTAVGGGVGGTATTSGGGSAASTSAAGGSGGSGNNSGPTTPTVVGGVVGGVAGLTVILLLLLLLLRWWKRKARQRAVDESPSRAAALPPSTTQTPSQPMSQDPRPTSHTPLMSALSPAFLSRWRMSSGAQTASSSTTVPLPSERGFRKVSGRKIDSVLTSGGDGYGDAASSKETAPSTFSGPSAFSAPSAVPVPPPVLSDTSFYRDSQGFYGGVGLQPSPRPSGQMQRDSGAPGTITSDDGSDIVVMRPSPARTPITSSPGVSMAAFPNPPTPRAPGTTTPRTATPPLTALPHPRDALGRSHPSFDGSRGSRFTESV